MKVTALSLWKWNGDKAEPTCLGKAEDVAEFGYFQRGSVREMLTFISRTIVKRTQPGQRQSVEQDQYLVHVTNRGGLVAIAVATTINATAALRARADGRRRAQQGAPRADFIRVTNPRQKACASL